ncbi:MAG: N-methyl-L-tryptophan oxidase [Armatimonas sp.]
MKIAVIGVGAVGSAACRFLAEAGADVVGFERFNIGHGFGSSHGESRIIRYAYDDPDYTRLMGRAYPLWDELEQKAGEELFVRCGGLYFGPKDNSELNAVEAALAVNGVAHERLSADQLTERYPGIRLDSHEEAIWQADAGFLRAGSVVKANARLAREAGADLRENAPIENLADLSGFDRVVVTAGAWTTKLIPERKLPLSVTRQQVTYLAGELENYPVWIDAESHWYGFPSDGRVPGVKLAKHEAADAFDPTQPDRPTSALDDNAAIAYAAHRFPTLKPEVTHSVSCLYTNTPDEDFLYAQPNEKTLALSACSGHGFKFSVLIGRFAADWALTGTVPHELTRFSERRFQLK